MLIQAIFHQELSLELLFVIVIIIIIIIIIINFFFGRLPGSVFRERTLC